jgi:phenylalanyl-tRNA synthetase beta chain
LKKYLHIIENEPRFPVIYDKNRVVLSLPPIINGNHSKIRLSTKNVLIEVTATDNTKANVVLNTVVTMFAQYSSPQWRYTLAKRPSKERKTNHPVCSIENVEVQDAEGKIHVFPDISSRSQTASIDYINKCVGVDVKTEEIVTLLNRMSLPAELEKDGKHVRVAVPPTRSDIMLISVHVSRPSLK